MDMSARLFCITILLLNFVPATLQVCGQASHGPAVNSSGLGAERKLFGVLLRPGVVKLVKEVERKYGKKVREAPNSNLDLIAHAAAAWDTDGTPVIKIKSGITPTEAIIVHELFHLKYQYATIEFVPYDGWGTPDNEAYIQFILTHLYSSIQHWMFFPKMLKMGLNPETEVREGFEQLIRQNYLPDFKGMHTGEIRTLLYFKAVMNINDRTMLARINQWYKNNGWNAELNVGRQLERIITKAKPQTVDDAVRVFVKCLEYIQRPNAHFKFRERTVKRIGGLNVPWVIVDVTSGL